MTITLKKIQEETSSVVAPIDGFPDYFVARDEDIVFSVKSGTPKRIYVSNVNGSKVVALRKNGRTTSRRIHKLRDEAQFQDVRPAVEANVYTRAAKLNAEAVRDIRSSPHPQSLLAWKYEVTQSTISQVINHKTWRWVV